MDERTRLLPPFNLNASCPQDVFPLDKLLPPRVLEALAPEIDALSTVSARSYQQLAKSGVYQPCVLSRLLALSTTAMDIKDTTTRTKTPDRMRIAQCLALISHMLALYKLHQSDIQRKQPLPDTPVVVAKYLLSEFTAMVSRGGSSFLKVRYVHGLVFKDGSTYVCGTRSLLIYCISFSYADLVIQVLAQLIAHYFFSGTLSCVSVQFR